MSKCVSALKKLLTILYPHFPSSEENGGTQKTTTVTILWTKWQHQTSNLTLSSRTMNITERLLYEMFGNDLFWHSLTVSTISETQDSTWCLSVGTRLGVKAWCTSDRTCLKSIYLCSSLSSSLPSSSWCRWVCSAGRLNSITRVEGSLRFENFNWKPWGVGHLPRTPSFVRWKNLSRAVGASSVTLHLSSCVTLHWPKITIFGSGT